MYFYKKILILLIIIIFSYLLYRLIQKRNQTLRGEFFSIRESYTPYTIQPQNTFNQSLMLNEYSIKSSLHSALNSKNKNYTIDCNSSLKTVLQRGVRFLDFEIYSVSGQPTVGYSSNLDSTNVNNEATNTPEDTSIQLNNVFSFILSNKPVSITDPLFIQLRIKSQKPEIYTSIANYITKLFGGALYLDNKGKAVKINGNTVYLLSQIKLLL